MDDATTDGAAPTNRLDRRKARTRQALVDAAVRLIAEGRGERASIQEITEAADIGFGSFYNHFTSKEELFQTASEEALERWAQVIDARLRRSRRPGRGVRHLAAHLRPPRLGPPRNCRFHHRRRPRPPRRASRTRTPRPARYPRRPGRRPLHHPGRRDRAQRRRRRTLGLLRLHARNPERVTEASVDELTEACLRFLGLPAAQARRLARPPPPRRTLVAPTTLTAMRRNERCRDYLPL